MKKTSDFKDFLLMLENRFNANKNRHAKINWSDVEKRLQQNALKLEVLKRMEDSGGEPDVVKFDDLSNEYLFFDCAAESPKERRSLCYDKEAFDQRKENKPKSSALEYAAAIGIELLSEEEYRFLQTLGKFDQKTSSWLKTPENVRKLGGAIFGDLRFETVFIYHNGAESYYGGRGFRGVLRV